MALDNYKKLYLDDDLTLTIKASIFNQTILNQYVNYSVLKYVKTKVETSPADANWVTVFEGRAFFADKSSELNVDIKPFVEDNIEYRDIETAKKSVTLTNGKWLDNEGGINYTKRSNNFTAWRLKATIDSTIRYSPIVEVLPFYHYSHINYKWNVPKNEIIGLFDNTTTVLNIVMQGYNNALHATGVDEKQAVLLPHYPYNVGNLPVHIQTQMNQIMEGVDPDTFNGWFCIIDEYGIRTLVADEMDGQIISNTVGLISQNVSVYIPITPYVDGVNSSGRRFYVKRDETVDEGYRIFTKNDLAPESKNPEHIQFAFFHKDFYNKTDNVLYMRPILEYDVCPADYYVMWRDRYNAMNCQPVLNNVKMSNNYSRVNKTNSKGEQKIVSVETSSSWVVNTDWLTHEKYYVWESILVSPEIYLIDTKNRYTYRVVITDNIYNEKTRDNNNKMFNLTLNLKNDHTKTITY